MFNQKRYEQLLSNWHDCKGFQIQEDFREYNRLFYYRREFLRQCKP
jgi:hypothetical protein